MLGNEVGFYSIFKWTALQTQAYTPSPPSFKDYMIYDLTNTQFIKGLRNLLHILDKGAQFADAKKIDMTVLLRN